MLPSALLLLLFLPILGFSLLGLCFVVQRVPIDYGMLDILKLPRGLVMFLVALASTSGIIVSVFGTLWSVLRLFLSC
jgi:hypothetical protein